LAPDDEGLKNVDHGALFVAVAFFRGYIQHGMKTLELSTEDFRPLAANVVELCSEYVPTLDGRSVFPRVTGPESERFFDLDLPEHGMGDQAFAALTARPEGSLGGA
jgi:hypothetical protein